MLTKPSCLDPMFPCPSCQQKLPAWQVLSSGAWAPKTCPHCAEKYFGGGVNGALGWLYAGFGAAFLMEPPGQRFGALRGLPYRRARHSYASRAEEQASAAQSLAQRDSPHASPLSRVSRLSRHRFCIPLGHLSERRIPYPISSSGTVWSNPSIERTPSGRLRLPTVTAHVER